MRRVLVGLVGLLVVGAALLTGVAAGGSGRSDARWVMRDLRVLGIVPRSRLGDGHEPWRFARQPYGASVRRA